MVMDVVVLPKEGEEVGEDHGGGGGADANRGGRGSAVTRGFKCQISILNGTQFLYQITYIRRYTRDISISDAILGILYIIVDNVLVVIMF